jgi:membrane associated rhomboid family serine protease
MSERVQLGGFPRPGPALKFVLGLVAFTSLATALAQNWGGGTGTEIIALLPCSPELVRQGQVWRLATSGILTVGLSQVIFSLIGLYFLSPDLEKTMGKWRFLRFLVLSVIFGNVLAIAADAVAPLSLAIFHPAHALFGPGAAITATAIAWAKANAKLQVRLFFILPVTGKQLYYATIGFCLLGLVYFADVPEGVVTPFGGILTGIFFAGNPSPARALYLRTKLVFLRRQKGHVSAASLLEGGTKKKKSGGPELRVVLGGLEDKLKDQPPKDKRYLN